MLTTPLSKARGPPHSPELSAVSNGDSWFPKGAARGLAVAAMERKKEQEAIRSPSSLCSPSLFTQTNACHPLVMYPQGN